MRVSAAAIVAIGVLFSVGAEASEPCSPQGELFLDDMGTPDDDLARVGELLSAIAPSPRLIRRGGARSEDICEEGALPATLLPLPGAGRGGEGPGDRVRSTQASLHTLPLRLTSVWNSRYPSGQNDALLWAGRGLSQQLSAGVSLRYGAISAALAPAVAWSENRAFDIVANGRSGDLAFGNPYYGNGIDLPQRFGAGPFAAWSPGQSFVRADLWNVGLGISTENFWFGPGIRNSILMSNAGPGFPHVFLGTSRPGDIWIGKAEALLFWGRLERTRFIAGGSHPLIQGLALSYEPRWIPGLYVGLGRVLLQRWDDLSLREWLAVFQSFRKKDLESVNGPGGDNPGDNQLVSLFARWVFPESHVELYGEWAREDHEWDLAHVIGEPDHSQAFLLGFQKVFRAGSRRVRMLAELTHLQELRPLDNQRGVPVYYTHGADLGYTHRGQLLGAFIGPGADSQTLAVDVFHRRGRIGGYVERVRRNDAYYWAVVEPAGGVSLHDAELTFGARQVLAAGPLEVSWEAAWAWRQNRDFIRNEPNFRVALGLAMPLAR